MVEVSQLFKDYNDGGRTYAALRGVSFRVARGEFAAIMGPSGCGKSTLLNILGLLDKPSSGSYRLAGAEVAALTDLERTLMRRSTLGFVFQSFNLLPRLSALENVCLPMVYAGISKEERRAKAQALLERVGLGAKGEHSPLQLSGGERQRVGIARALANGPSVLLADEPTGNLDSRTSVEIMELFGELHRSGMTLLLVTHDGGVTARAQRVLHIQDGQVSKEELSGGAR